MVMEGKDKTVPEDEISHLEIEEEKNKEGQNLDSKTFWKDKSIVISFHIGEIGSEKLKELLYKNG